MFVEDGNTINFGQDKFMGGSKLVSSGNISSIIHVKGTPYLPTSEAYLSSIYVSGVMFFGDFSSTGTTNGIYIDTPGAPSRPFVIENCTFQFLNNGILVENNHASYSTAVANAIISKNVFTLNNMGVKATGLSAILQMDFSNNVAEGNIVGALELYDDVSERVVNANIRIFNNLLENQPTPIKIKCLKSNVTIDHNYFEITSGIQTVYIQGRALTNVFLGKNFVSDDNALKYVLKGVNYKFESCR